MSYPSVEQALHFWFSRINYEQRTPRAGDLQLDRMQALLSRFGNPQERLRIVHVAGSKGKGSTSAMLASVLRQAGYRTGLFTSPHLCRIEERFQIDGECISLNELTEFISEIRSAIERASPSLEVTFFEIATAIGFLHFARRHVDIAVIEVGLGGRFDSTNVCLPMVSVITSISFDHTQQLGNNLASIAMEKGGIIKTGRPVVSGAVPAEARSVIEQICSERQAPLYQLGVDFHYEYEVAHVQRSVGGGRVNADLSSIETGPKEKTRVRAMTRQKTWPEMELGLLGEHQAANASVAIACIERLQAEGWHIPDRAVVDGLASVRWPARLEIVGRRPLVVLDCAHNVASAEALIQTLTESFPPTRRLLIFASSHDKDLPGILRVLTPHFAHVFLTRYIGSSRSTPTEQLASLLQEASDRPFTLHETPEEAWLAARSMANSDELICVTGSVFLAGELRPMVLGERPA